MNRSSIAFKLFTITLVVFLTFIATALVVQGIFFESFYSERKANNLNVSLDNFIENYTESAWSYDELRSNITAFNDYNDSHMAIVSENRMFANEKRYQLIIETDAGEQIVVYLNGFTDEKDFAAQIPKYFDHIRVTGYKWSQGVKIMIPYSVSINDQVWFDYTGSTSNEATETIEGTLIGFSVPSNDDIREGLVSSEMGLVLENHFRRDVKKIVNPNEVIDVEYRDSNNNRIQKAYYAEITINNRKQLIFVLSSDKLVKEALQVLEDFYVYVFVGAFLVLVMLSIAYSFMISNPLVRLNKVAIKMAALDFSEELDVNSEDEIGSLANSLNTMSRNLNTSLIDLKAANDKLTQDIERERELEALRKDFVSGISHELKTPLGIIRGYSEGLKDGIFDEDPDHYFDIILDEVNRMDLLVMDMLELSKLESESFSIDGDYFDMKQLIDFLKDKLEFQLVEKSLKINIEYDSGIVYCFGDEHKIEQVLVNFLSNAIRHSKNDSCIEIKCVRVEDKILCSVYNEGNHIPEEKLDKIWDKFYRVQESRAKKDGGTGLGLAIVKNILKHHESSYGVENTEKGVKFYFTLPHHTN